MSSVLLYLKYLKGSARRYYPALVFHCCDSNSSNASSRYVSTTRSQNRPIRAPGGYFPLSSMKEGQEVRESLYQYVSTFKNARLIAAGGSCSSGVCRTGPHRYRFFLRCWPLTACNCKGTRPRSNTEHAIPKFRESVTISVQSIRVLFPCTRLLMSINAKVAW